MFPNMGDQQDSSRVVMTLLVRDEADIIKENILWHLEQGVDFVVVTDNNSVDGTPDIVREFERQGVAKLLLETDDDYDQAKWVTRMAIMARDTFGGTWLLNNDADEFWICRHGKGSLKNSLAEINSD